jgi:hypothetical protein
MAMLTLEPPENYLVEEKFLPSLSCLCFPLIYHLLESAIADTAPWR